MGEIADKTKGRIKQAAGDLSGNAGLRREGVADEMKGNIKGVAQGAKNAVKEVGRAVKNAVK